MNKRLLTSAVIFIFSLSIIKVFAAESIDAVSLPVKESDQIAAKTRANPFLTNNEEDSLKSKEGRITIDYLSLSAIFYSPPNSCAIIAGKIVKEGDIIDNKEIIKINAEDIILKDTQSEYIIQLKVVLNSRS